MAPGLPRIPILAVGPFKCVLTLDKASGPIFPHLLHLSLSHALGLGDLADYDVAFLVSLFFSPEEAQQLTREEGHIGPIVHFRLACGLPDAVAC